MENVRGSNGSLCYGNHFPFPSRVEGFLDCCGESFDFFMLTRDAIYGRNFQIYDQNEKIIWGRAYNGKISIFHLSKIDGHKVSQASHFTTPQ
jgi:hypothetical protein